MKNPVSIKILSKLALLLLANFAGGMLIYQTYLIAQRTDEAAIAYGQNIAHSISAVVQNTSLSSKPDALAHLSENLLKTEHIEGILIIDPEKNDILRSGTPIPLSLVNRFINNGTLGIRQQNTLYISNQLIQPQSSTKHIVATEKRGGYIILALADTEGPQRRNLLLAYVLVGTVILLMLDLMIFIRRKKRTRGDVSDVNAPPPASSKKKKEHIQLEHSIGLQQQAIDTARQEALKASEIKSQFIANMSHEIRTPLNAIIGFTDLLLKTQLDNKQRDFLSTIRKSSIGLLQIINDILDFSKIEAGKIALDEISISLRDTIEDVLTVLAPSAHEKKIELACTIYPEVPNLILADPLRLKQILTNLVSNGIKFTNHGSVIVRAMINKKEKQQSVIKIIVSDTGIGIAEKKQVVLFNAFSQADTSTTRQFGGTGLGLVIAKQLVEQMHGEIGVRSLPGQGANFWFTFTAKSMDTNRSDSTLAPIDGGHIAVFDAHPIARLATIRRLKAWQLQTYSSTNLRQMAQYIESHYSSNPVDIAIISLSFTDTDWQLAETLINRLKTEFNCETILQHNTVNEDEHEACISQLSCTKLAKPVRQQNLYNEISRLLSKSTNLASTPTMDNSSISRFIDRKPTVLAVDDNPANLKLVQELLTDLGARVYTAISGQDALNLLKAESFDIVYMDIQMPGMDGVETTRRIRNTPSAYRDVPIIALTAHALESEKEHLLASGLDDYLSKPVTEQQLLDTILDWTDVKASTISVEDSSKNNRAELSERHTKGENEVVDLEMALRLAAGKKELAQELFDMLLNSLKEEQASIIEAFQNNDRDSLLHNVHRLHGATRYCGVPALQSATAYVESTLKQTPSEDLHKAMENLNYEIQRLNNWAGSNS